MEMYFNLRQRLTHYIRHQLVIGGLGKIDLDDWKANTRLKHCNLESNIVKWFWRAVEEYNEERRARLLQFVTGSSRVPLQGLCS
jgi:E3 ubiquitin ligase SMURF1/2